jgi:chitinase
VGRHRKRQRRHRRRATIALISTGLLVPLTGGAVVFAATDPGRLAAKPPRSHSAVTRQATPDPGSGERPAAGGASAPSPRTRPSTVSAPSSPAPGPRIDFAPYADVLSWPPLDLSKTHVKAYTMGFVAAGGGCSAAWGGLSPVDAAFAVRRIKDVPGKVILSFGGPHGTELAQSCDSVDALVKQYRKALDATDPAGTDFYLTDGTLSDSLAVRRWSQALARIQGEGKDRSMSVTLPLHRTGLSASALAALRTAAADGARVSIVNLVPADGAGQSVTASATAAHGQLQRLYHQGDAQVWQRMGLTPIIGVAGVGAQFRPADARQLLTWATAHHLGRLSMWSVTRDAPCTVGTSVTGDTCSGLDEDTGVFTKIFQTF